MFGNNPKRGAVRGDGSTLFIQSIFQTLQGEGPNVGMPSVFVRLGGCNLACSFCDTEFEDFTEFTREEILRRVDSLSLNDKGKKVVQLVVITGGEPLRQEIAPLCEELLEKGYTVQIETNGTLYRDLPDEVQIICSPKISGGKYLQVRPDLLPKIYSLKFIVSAGLDGYNDIADVGQTIHPVPVFVQPMDEYDSAKNQANRELAVQLALENGYRVSLQTHKLLEIE